MGTRRPVRPGSVAGAAEAWAPPDGSMVRICDLAGRPRGTGFAIDTLGTLLTSHETVDSVTRTVLHGADGRTCVVADDDVVPLPDTGLALVRSHGLGLVPLPVSTRPQVATGSYVRIAAAGWREARVLGESAVTYTSARGAHRIGGALELAVGTAGSDALRPGGGAAGGPVIDAATGAVLGVVGTALDAGRRAAGLAVPLRTGSRGPLARALAVNATTVPAYGADLNLAGVLALTAAHDRSPSLPAHHITRDEPARRLTAFGDGPAAVCLLTGPPGSGRTTELAAYTARRARGRTPAPTVWLRGGDIPGTDTGLADAVGRVLHRRAPRGTAVSPPSPSPAPFPAAGPEEWRTAAARLAQVARVGGRPLVVVLDAPEDMGHGRAHGSPGRLHDWTMAWTARTAAWLDRYGVRLVLACGPEYADRAAHGFLTAAPPGTGGRGAAPVRVPLGDLTADEARRLRARLGVPDDAVAPDAAAHPLALTLLAGVRAALPVPPPGRPGRHEILGAQLDLLCLRTAERLTGPGRADPGELRRLAAGLRGRARQAASRAHPGPAGRGEVSPAVFEELFPRRTGWAAAVLMEELLVPTGTGYRFRHEELGDRLQAVRLDPARAVAALLTAVEQRVPPQDRSRGRSQGPDGPDRPGRPELGGGSGIGAVRDGGSVGDGSGRGIGPWDGTGSVGDSGLVGGSGLVRDGDPRRGIGPVRGFGPAGGLGSVGGLGVVPGGGAGWGIVRARDAGAGGGGVVGGGAAVLPPPFRLGPVVAALLRTGRERGPDRLRDLLTALVARAPEPGPGGRWAAVVLADVFARLPDATPYLGVLRDLAERTARTAATRRDGDGPPGTGPPFGPSFWLTPRLPDADRLELLRLLVVADGPGGGPAGPRYLDTVAALLRADPGRTAPPLLRWFTDGRPLPAAPGATVADVAQSVLYAERRRAPAALVEALAADPHPRGEELMAALAADETAALCAAVARWARHGRHAEAARYGPRAAAHAVREGDRAALRDAAHLLLGAGEPAGAGLAMLVLDPLTRARFLTVALDRFASGDRAMPSAALEGALRTHPGPVLAAFEARLRHAPPAVVAEGLRTLAGVTAPAPAHRIAALVRELAVRRPEVARAAAGYVQRRAEQGAAAVDVLRPLVTALAEGAAAEVRAALAAVLAAPGAEGSRGPCRELLDALLAGEHDPEVLAAALRAAAGGTARAGEAAPTRPGPARHTSTARPEGPGGRAVLPALTAFPALPALPALPVPPALPGPPGPAPGRVPDGFAPSAYRDSPDTRGCVVSQPDADAGPTGTAWHS
ncbi:serine protease [Streptomyces uncialis]|uniref:serine protease n=1 Tax=Streptomyces uncialis TaxID=1048205 RepID=UPI0022513617|nr:serine protease [Streptomyces uncialis]MCX4659776.1 serine protease [Streptomyces uncialis]